MEVEKFNKIEIVPNSTDGVDVSIDGEKVDTEDITELTLGIAKDTDGNFSCFELSAKKRLCFFNYDKKANNKWQRNPLKLIFRFHQSASYNKTLKDTKQR